jgi:hypothetical protein
MMTASTWPQFPSLEEDMCELRSIVCGALVLALDARSMHRNLRLLLQQITETLCHYDAYFSASLQRVFPGDGRVSIIQ